MKDPYVLKNELLASKYDEFVNAGYAGYLKVNSDIIKKVQIYGEKEFNTFFGYYDLPQISEDGTKMLVMKVNRGASTITDYAEIYYINLVNNSWHYISQTRAWCWQQGCRLRWLPHSNCKIMFNNMVEGKYVSEIWDINTTTMINQYPYAFYDVDFEKKLG